MLAFLLFFKMADAAILYFQNVEILGVGSVKRVKMRHRAKFALTSQMVAETWQFFDFYSAPHSRRCTRYGNSVRLSVRPSHAGIVSK